MTSLTIGDMAQTLALRRQNSDLKATLNRLTEEMTSGQKADLAQATSGDFRALAGIDHSLAALGAFKTSTAEAGLFVTTLQQGLDVVQGLASDAAPALSQAGTTGSPTQVRTAAFDARQRLFSAVSAMNLRAGDRYALSGVATDRQPLSGAQDILDGLKGAIAGQVTVSGAVAAADAWFDAPAGGGGFLDSVYGGSATALAPFRLGEGDEASVTLTAADPTLRETLKGLALAGIVAEGALAGDSAGQAGLLQAAGQRLLAAGSGMAELRGNLGSTEGAIAAAEAHNGAEAAALQTARSAITAADPYETGTALEAARTQLETLYTLTARLSRLTLADYLR
ncbi:MAG: flagellar biosynthesis protein FlgL [Proteobacteria bacterium]|nr:flagellar biosynthesis protein FlgL [Pseudomonadota bacterium]MBS0573079.1 flagellar biosynthesis protein FlgL [Pseudomonadota bacterium]